MPIHWPEATVRGRELTVYMGPGAVRSVVWMNVLGHLLKEFNALSKAHKLPMRMKASKEAPKDGSGADVAINIAVNDKISLTFPRRDPIVETLAATRLHGRTLLLSEETAKNVLIKAFVYLPAKPLISTPQAVRPVGPKVLTVIALHELLHACGLENEDHGNSGLFQGNPKVDSGTTAIHDAVGVDAQMSKKMPPYVIDDATVQTLLERWTP
jgi:hypothetical protein